MPRPVDADPLPIGKRRYRAEPQRALGGEGALRRDQGDHPGRNPHRTRSGPRSLLSRGAVQLPLYAPSQKPLPRSGLSHHGDAGIGRSLKMRRLPPPPSHGGSPFGAPARPPWRESLPRLRRVLSAGPMPSGPHLRGAVGSLFKMRPPIAAAHARRDRTVPQSIDRAAPPTDGCVASSLCRHFPHR